jgi:GT2 family glycosyltransferase
MERAPLVSVIIVNYNGKKYLKGCIDSLLQGEYKNIEIVLVDNGSSDGSIDLVRSLYSNVSIVDNKSNLGLAVASNKGAEAARGEYLFFFNNDTIADRQLVSSLVRKVQEDPEVGIAGCRTYTYDGRSLINAGVPCDIFSYPYGSSEPFYVDAAIFIRRDLFSRLTGFDEKMFLYGEDRDICWRCWLSGYKVSVAEEAKFYHDSACVTDDLKEYQTNIAKRFWSEFNALRAIMKNYSAYSMLFILPSYAAVNIAEVCVFLFRGQWRVIREAYLRAYVENFKDLKGLLKERSRVQKGRRISDLALLSHMDKISGKLRLLFKMGIPAFSEKAKYSNA